MRAALLNPTGAVALAAMAFAPLPPPSAGAQSTVAGSPGGRVG